MRRKTIYYSKFKPSLTFTGGYSVQSYQEIFEFDPLSSSWILGGLMNHRRSYHAVSEVDYTDIAEFCNKPGQVKLIEDSLFIFTLFQVYGSNLVIVGLVMGAGIQKSTPSFLQ